jgi:hypothetical protein
MAPVEPSQAVSLFFRLQDGYEPDRATPPSHVGTTGMQAFQLLEWLKPPVLRDVPVPVNFFSLPHECSVTVPYWGSIPELTEVVSLAQAGKIKMIVEHFPLERAGEAYHLLRDGKIQGRAVITPNG